MIKKITFRTCFLLLAAIVISSFSAASAGMSDLTTSLSHQQPVYSAPSENDMNQMPPASFCDPVEISIAIAQNAFEKDYKPNSNEVVKVKKPVRWSVVKAYSNLPEDAVPYELLHRGTRSEGYFNLSGDYRFGEPATEETAAFLLEYENYVEIVFSLYTAEGLLIEDIAGVYQVNANTQELVTDSSTLLKRLLKLYQSDATLPVYECLSFQLADTSIKKAQRNHDFSLFFEYADFIEARCSNLNHTPLYSADDLHAYYGLLENLNQSLNVFMFQLRSGALENHAVLRQCRNAITRIEEVKEILAETLAIK